MKKNHGFTLIELLIAMAVGLVVLGAVYSVFIVQNKELNKQEQIAVMQQNARMAMEMMTKEIMMAGYGASTLTRCSGTTTAAATTPPCLGILNAANILQFNMDITNTTGTSLLPDGLTDGPNETITYGLYTSTAGGVSVQCLGRKSSVNSNYQPVVENIQSLAFTYLTAAGASTTDLSLIRIIKITIIAQTANVDPDLGTVRTYPLTTNVTPRNLGLTGY